MIDDVDVVIAGGGPVGLSLAMELGRRAVRTLLIEPRLEVDRSIPRARLVNPRTVGVLRRLGLSRELKSEAEFPESFPNDVVFVSSMTGYEILRIDDAFFAGQAPTSFVEASVSAHQYQLETVLRKGLAALETVTTCFGSRVTDVQLEPDGASVAIEHADGTSVVSARYAIGADGSGSNTRAGTGIHMSGEGKLSSNAQLVFQSHGLWQRSGKKPGMMFWILNEDVQALLLPFRASDDTFILSLYHTGGIELTPETCERLIRNAIGDPAADVSLLHISPWSTYALLADQYSQGAFWLVGDAAHVHPTYGGHGMNLGVGDAVNLGWKLAGVIHGWAPARLLESYEIERRPVAERVLLESTQEFRTTPRELFRPRLDEAGPDGELARANLSDEIKERKAKQFRSIGTQLGYTYHNSPVIVPDGSVPPEWMTNTYEPSASPGALAPHVWLRDGVALYDVCGPDFTILCIGNDKTVATDLLAAAQRAGVPCVLVLEDGEELRRQYEALCVVIRPDLHVAWRGGSEPIDADGIWRRIVGFDLPQPTGQNRKQVSPTAA